MERLEGGDGVGRPARLEEDGGAAEERAAEARQQLERQIASAQGEAEACEWQSYPLSSRPAWGLSGRSAFGWSRYGVGVLGHRRVGLLVAAEAGRHVGMQSRAAVAVVDQPCLDARERLRVGLGLELG